MSLAPDGDIGYILVVYLAYARDLHSGHSDYPLAPKRVAVKGCQLSRNQRNVLRTQILKENSDLPEDKINAKIDAYESVEKLIHNLSDKKNTFFTIETYNFI